MIEREKQNTVIPIAGSHFDIIDCRMHHPWAECTTGKPTGPSVNLRAAYSPVALELAGYDLGLTGEMYFDKISNMHAENNSEEQVRLVYVKYLYIVWNTGDYIGDAATYESQGDYAGAATYAQNALTSLQGIKQLPNQDPKSTLNRLMGYLENYAYTMQNYAQLQSSAANAQGVIQNSRVYQRNSQ
jgi:hypothetical protein